MSAIRIAPCPPYIFGSVGYADYEAVVTLGKAKALVADNAPNATPDHFKARGKNMD